jgi:hypothetical protein
LAAARRGQQEIIGEEVAVGPGAGGSHARLQEATMEEHFVWMTTRRIKPGTLAQFERAWRPDTHPLACEDLTGVNVWCGCH